MAPKHDIGWEHVEPFGGNRRTPKCNYYRNVIHGGITRLKQHITYISGQVEGCQSVSAEVSQGIKLYMSNASNKKIQMKKPLRVVSIDGREWGKGIAVAPLEGVQAVGGLGSLREEPSKVSPDCMGYNSWEDSCLIKFSEYLGVTTAGFEEEILELLRKMEVQQQGDKRKGYPTETRCERELRKLECTINYNGKGQTRDGRDRGNFLLKLK